MWTESLALDLHLSRVATYLALIKVMFPRLSSLDRSGGFLEKDSPADEISFSNESTTKQNIFVSMMQSTALNTSTN